jgi:hypothetical protein
MKFSSEPIIGFSWFDLSTIVLINVSISPAAAAAALRIQIVVPEDMVELIVGCSEEIAPGPRQ